MLDANIKSQLSTYFERIRLPLELRASLDDGGKSSELRAFLEEIAGLSDKITLVDEQPRAARVPSFAIARIDSDVSVRFAGIPLGHELTSLVLALLQVGGHPAKIEDAVVGQIRGLSGEYRFETYFSQSCQNCPDVVQALNAMSVINPAIQHVAIDGAFFRDEVEAREILSVPSVFLNGELFHQGRAGVEELLAKLDTGDDTRRVDELNARDEFDVLVVGGGPAGAAAAVYAARKGIRTAVVAERFGGQVLDTLAIENYLSVLETEGPKFGLALEQHVKAYEVDIINLQRAAKLIPGKSIRVELASGATLKAKTVILSTGARWREINVPGEREYRNRGVAYCPHCDGPLFKGRRVAVIGGGNSGVEAAIDLAGIVGHVTLIEFDQALRADDILQRKLRTLPNVDVITSAQTTGITGDGKRVTGLDYSSRVDGSVHHVDLEGVFVQIGLVPNTEWLRGAVALTPRGEIEVDARGQTSVPGVFAAGDVTTVPYKQIIIAAGDGAKAALGAFDHLIRSSVDEDEENVPAVANVV
ncbi:MAG TPA: alkyl hydroperoxide reductase subunit F [Burkholderiaceae bacterium]|nr:alkyl hydroperoxide reductase subunit F [Burkholderiaceae bacterium]